MQTKSRKINFTKAAIEALELPDAGRVYVYDAKAAGLAICLTAAGGRTFYSYRKIGGKPERIRIGAWPELTVEQARTYAAGINGKISEGANPNDKRRINREAPTLAVAFEHFIALPTRTKAKRPRSATTQHGYRYLHDTYLNRDVPVGTSRADHPFRPACSSSR